MYTTRLDQVPPTTFARPSSINLALKKCNSMSILPILVNNGLESHLIQYNKVIQPNNTQPHNHKLHTQIRHINNHKLHTQIIQPINHQP
jgi:hypothetical protein